MKTYAILGLFVLLISVVAGCSLLEVEETVGVAEKEVSSISIQLEQAEFDLIEINKEVEALPEGPEKEKALEMQRTLLSYVVVVNEKLKIAEESLVKLKEDMANAPDDIGKIGAIGEAAKPFIPVPYQPLFGAVLGLTVGLVRAAYNKWNGKKVIRSVNNLVQPEGSQIDIIRAEQGYFGNRLVDEAQGKRFSLPF